MHYTTVFNVNLQLMCCLLFRIVRQITIAIMSTVVHVNDNLHHESDRKQLTSVLPLFVQDKFKVFSHMKDILLSQE